MIGIRRAVEGEIVGRGGDEDVKAAVRRPSAVGRGLGKGKNEIGGVGKSGNGRSRVFSEAERVRPGAVGPTTPLMSYPSTVKQGLGGPTQHQLPGRIIFTLNSNYIGRKF